MKSVPDADASLLGQLGLCNPITSWLLTRAPDMLVLTPGEWRDNTVPPPRRCPDIMRCNCWMCLRQRSTGQFVFRCYQHDPPIEVEAPRRRPNADRLPDADAVAMIGKTVGYVYDAERGGWNLEVTS